MTRENRTDYTAQDLRDYRNYFVNRNSATRGGVQKRILKNIVLWKEDSFDICINYLFVAPKKINKGNSL